MKLKNTVIHVLVQVLNQLDPAIGRSPYKLNGKVRFAMAKNLRKLQVELDTLETVRQKLIEEYGLTPTKQPDGSSRLDGEKFAEYEQAFNDVLDAETEVDLHQITEADLDLDANQIPFTLLSPLIGTLVV